MIRFAIVKPVGSKDGRTFYKPIFEGEDGEFKRELTSRVGRILGPKESFTIGEINSAIDMAFEEYKKEFKEKTITLG